MIMFEPNKYLLLLLPINAPEFTGTLVSSPLYVYYCEAPYLFLVDVNLRFRVNSQLLGLYLLD